MPITLAIVVTLVGYLLGSIPFGFVFLKVFTGQDVRTLGSGRTGSTNVMRAGGGKIAMLTGLCDGLKGAVAVWFAQWLIPDWHWAEVLAGLAAILGHNYSIFIGFKGGAGGAPTVGTASALWVWGLFFIAPIGLLVWYFIGYASLATISFAVTALVIMIVRWYLGQSPVEYIAFAALALTLCLWSLRPNLKRLMEGTERLHGWRAKRQKQAQETH